MAAYYCLQTIIAHLPRFPAAAALLVVLPADIATEGAASDSSTGVPVRGVRLRLAAGFALVLGSSGCGTEDSSSEGALRLREVFIDTGGGLGTTIGDVRFGFVSSVSVSAAVVLLGRDDLVLALEVGDVLFGLAVVPTEAFCGCRLCGVAFDAGLRAELAA